MNKTDHLVHFLHVYAKAKSHQDKIEHWIEEGGRFRLQLSVTPPPQGGEANKAIIKLLAQTLGITQGNISLVRGATRRYKTFRIDSWSNLLAKKLPAQPRVCTLFDGIYEQTN